LSKVAGKRTRDEVAAAIRGFSPADRARLESASRFFGRARGLEPEVLLQEALVRAVDSRSCPDHVDVVRFVAQIMRSVAHGESEKLENQVDLVAIDQTGGGSDAACQVADETDNAEAQLMSAERAEACKKMHGGIIALFKDDESALLIFEGMTDDLSLSEMLELTGLDKTSYQSKRKFIRRTIDKHFPNGWKP
jgi:hypothetical protein